MAQSALEAKKGLNKAWKENYDPEIFGVPESCTDVNDASRNLVYAMVADSESGEVWLGHINRYDKDDSLMSPYRGPVQLLAESGLGNGNAKVRGTGWALYNGVTELVDHYNNAGSKRDDAKDMRLNSIGLGSGFDFKADALQTIADLCLS